MGFIIWRRRLEATGAASQTPRTKPVNAVFGILPSFSVPAEIPFMKFLEKFLLKLRVFILKTENKITFLLEMIRRRSSSVKNNNAGAAKSESKLKARDDYWDKLKTRSGQKQ